MSRYGRGGYKNNKGRALVKSENGTSGEGVPVIERSTVRVAGDNVRQLQDEIRADIKVTPVKREEEPAPIMPVILEHANIMTPPEPAPIPEPVAAQPSAPWGEEVKVTPKTVEIEESGGF